ncbi:uncharacterized protein LOC105432559 [Pogonomyrmex barbatus]|uniref:Uncharacterized protein LOC105432559 n=1 Tax=Pogonomyrmex barbatus TaxID=144034 RepID=A0A6I9XJ51_9HYME|nr:uncharacterized protein LOC105432559 [Pogonomyrmex barbatus]XP_011645717.1 uncharacterized protein LOC105432559 [Pogonomyrmex barbatus]
MDKLYPNLYERFKTEGLCPTCLMEMELTPRYSCLNGHTVCYRCKPYYYACPTCAAPLDMEIRPPPMSTPQPVHLMPHPMPSRNDHNPSAPPINDFLEHERRSWEPPAPSASQQLETCSYSHLGCWVKIPEHLRTLHESRCQFRPHLEEEQVPTDLHHGHDLVECSYSAAGCRVRTVPWRRSIHEKYCIYKDKFQGVNEISESLASATIGSNYDPEELVQCKYKRFGCMVNMPRRRKHMHELKCNYMSQQGDVDNNCFSYPSQPELDPNEQVECRWSVYGCQVRPKRYRKHVHEDKCNYKKEEHMHELRSDYGNYRGDVKDEFFSYPSQPELDPDEQVECRWYEHGCRVRPKRCRKQIHEDKCNYRMEECSWKHYGCSALFIPTLRYTHESNCDFAPR